MAGSKSIAEVLSGVSSELAAEAINLYLLTAALSILKYSGIFLLYFILKKYLGYLKEASLISESIFKGLNLFIIMSSMIYFFNSSYPHLETIIKIQVAPKIFLLQKGTEIVRGLK
jgi:hypothetical protein